MDRGCAWGAAAKNCKTGWCKPQCCFPPSCCTSSLLSVALSGFVGRKLEPSSLRQTVRYLRYRRWQWKQCCRSVTGVKAGVGTSVDGAEHTCCHSESSPFQTFPGSSWTGTTSVLPQCDLTIVQARVHPVKFSPAHLPLREDPSFLTLPAKEEKKL